MRNFLFPLILLVCPLMMIFMMKGMSGMHGGHGRNEAEDHQPERITAPGEGDRRDARLDELEREVAQLRTSRRPAGYREPTP